MIGRWDSNVSESHLRRIARIDRAANMAAANKKAHIVGDAETGLGYYCVLQTQHGGMGSTPREAWRNAANGG